jgi:alanine racemase
MASSPSRDVGAGVDGGLRAPARITRPAWTEIDLGAVRDNVRAISAVLRKPAGFMAVVKADAYGHGAVMVARAAVEAGASGLGVATLDEGVQLRRAGLNTSILVLGHATEDEAECAVADDLAVAVSRVEVARALGQAASRVGRRARVHLKIDTGMGRLGVAPGDAASLARTVTALDGVQLEGCFTHFATADERDLAFARAQLEQFVRVLREIEEAGVSTGVRHAANSAAAMALPESHLDLVRVGLALYGIRPAPHLADRVALRRVMRLRARVTHVKRVPPGATIGYGRAYRAERATTIATLPVGYADGYPRLLSGRGVVALRGHRLPVAGRISMDQCTIDAGDLPVRVGDEAELWGEEVPVEDVAGWAETISYEVLAGVSPRVPRVFVRDGQVVATRSLIGDGD